jgi:hypothetical protein
LVLVKDIEILYSVNSSIKNIFDCTNEEINSSINEVNNKLHEVEQELSLSQNMLEITESKELYTQAVLTEKIAIHLQADEQLTLAVDIGDPFLIAMASEGVARTANEVRIAEQEYEEAKQSRMRMEQRVELVNNVFYNSRELLEYLQTIFKNNIHHFDFLCQILNLRLNKASSSLASYLSQNYTNLSIEEQRIIAIDQYQYKLYQYNRGELSKKELNKSYIEKLNNIKKSFRTSTCTQIENIKISKYGLPEFESEYTVFVKPKNYDKSRDNHFRTANSNLKKKIEEDEELKKQFTSRQLVQIKIGKNPEGYTWHHDGNPPPGRIQLVKTDMHDKIRHDGGYSLWTNRKNRR